jgi:16S rRNA (cytosine967-C5)-methyltransferase
VGGRRGIRPVRPREGIRGDETRHGPPGHPPGGGVRQDRQGGVRQDLRRPGILRGPLNGHRDRNPAVLYQGARGLAIKILNRVERTDAYFDRLLDAELRSTELGDADKGLLAEIVHGVMRWQGRLDWVLNGFTHGNFSKSDVNIKNAMRVGLYQIFFLTQVPHYAAVNEAVEFVKRIRGEKTASMVNAVLRNILRTLEGIHYPNADNDPIQYLAVYHSHPQWMVRRWLERFSRDELVKILTANNEIPGLALRVNTLKVSAAEFLGILDARQIPYQGSALIDRFVRVRGLGAIAKMQIFQEGLFSIQDESAALPVLLLDPKPGESILDLCAAPGGKTTFISELMGNGGALTAVDRYEHKLELIRKGCERLGITNVTFAASDARSFAAGPVDRVLVDAPCSGLGTLRRKPDIKWKRQPEDIVKLAGLQSEILDNAAALLKPGGVLVYSTCTTEPEENQSQARSFLGRHGEFTVEDASAFVPKAVVTPEGFVETLPHRHHVDGSFAVRFRKLQTERT